eukprot:symbB.v1.2.013019.t1/scaffold914.1/size160365/12
MPKVAEHSIFGNLMNGERVAVHPRGTIQVPIFQPGSVPCSMGQANCSCNGCSKECLVVIQGDDPAAPSAPSTAGPPRTPSAPSVPETPSAVAVGLNGTESPSSEPSVLKGRKAPAPLSMDTFNSAPTESGRWKDGPNSEISRQEQRGGLSSKDRNGGELAGASQALVSSLREV